MTNPAVTFKMNLSELCYNSDMLNQQLITQQGFTSVQEAQAGISRLFKKAKGQGKFMTVLRNQEPLGVLIPQDIWEELLEDFEALSSQKYLNRIQQARQGRQRISSRLIKQRLELVQ